MSSPLMFRERNDEQERKDAAYQDRGRNGPLSLPILHKKKGATSSGGRALERLGRPDAAGQGAPEGHSRNRNFQGHDRRPRAWTRCLRPVRAQDKRTPAAWPFGQAQREIGRLKRAHGRSRIMALLSTRCSCKLRIINRLNRHQFMRITGRNRGLFSGIAGLEALEGDLAGGRVARNHDCPGRQALGRPYLDFPQDQDWDPRARANELEREPRPGRPEDAHELAVGAGGQDPAFEFTATRRSSAGS